MGAWVWLAIGCVDGGSRWDSWAPSSDLVGEEDPAVWTPYAAAASRAAGTWTTEVYDEAIDATEMYEPELMRHPAPRFESCRAGEGACSADVGDIRVEWSARPHPLDPTEEQYVPVFSFDGSPGRVPDAWEEVAWGGYSAFVPDTPREGCDTLLVTGSTGGMHCCTLSVLTTACPEGTTVSMVDSGDGDAFYVLRFMDVDADGTHEFVTTDWSWAYFGVSFAQSPSVWRVLSWSPEGWALAPRGRYAAFYAEQEEHARAGFSEAWRDAEEVYDRKDLSHVLALEVGSAAYLAGDDALTVEDVVADAVRLDRPGTPEWVQSAPSDVESLVDAIHERLSSYAKVRTIYAGSEGG